MISFIKSTSDTMENFSKLEQLIFLLALVSFTFLDTTKVIVSSLTPILENVPTDRLTVLAVYKFMLISSLLARFLKYHDIIIDNKTRDFLLTLSHLSTYIYIYYRIINDNLENPILWSLSISDNYMEIIILLPSFGIILLDFLAIIAAIIQELVYHYGYKVFIILTILSLLYIKK